MALEALTSVRTIGETSLTFTTCLFNAVFARVLTKAMREPQSTMPTKHFVLLSVLGFVSAVTSVWSLRYMSFITRVVGKSCKSIPILVLGACWFGKRYAFKKYVSVVVMSAGVVVFLAGTSSDQKASTSVQNVQIKLDQEQGAWDVVAGMSLMGVSLACDGATGALEDKYTHAYAVGAYELMFRLNLYKAVWSSLAVAAAGEFQYLLPSAQAFLAPLVALSASGAIGQAFIFFTINRFGALTSAMIGSIQKVVSIVVSVAVFHHDLSSLQVVGLVVTLCGVGVNWTPHCHDRHRSVEKVLDGDHEEAGLLLEDSDDDASLPTHSELSLSSATSTTSNEKPPVTISSKQSWDRLAAPIMSTPEPPAMIILPDARIGGLITRTQ